MPPFSGACCLLVGVDTRPVDHRQGVIKDAVECSLCLEGNQHLLSHSGLLPAAKPAADGLPGAIAIRQIPPGDAGAQDPEDAVEHDAMILGGAAGAWALRGHERAEPLPSIVGQFMSSYRIHAPRLSPFANRP
jgi:hypothetical protein